MSTSPTARDSAPVAERFCWRRHEVGPGVVRVSVTGELDLAAAATLEHVLGSVDNDGATAVIDLDGLTFIDPAGASSLRSAASQARRHGHRLIAVNGRPRVERCLALMGIDRELKLVSARSSLASPASTDPQASEARPA